MPKKMNPILATETDGVAAVSSIPMLTSGNRTDPISLYIHIPFCTKKCPYCHFYVVQDNERLKDLLLQALHDEISSYQEVLEKRPISSIYFGGGTPSLFGKARLESILQRFSYTPITYAPNCIPNCEITIEANPEEITKELLQSFLMIGINRISFGVQSLHNNELHILGRQHSSQKAIEAIQDAHHVGFDNITLDLMYETPGQTLDSFKESIQIAAALPIKHLSLYNLTFEEGTPFFRKEKELRKSVCDSETGTTMYQTAIDTLSQHGFTQYEISAFCREGKVSQHNSGYWTGREFLGFGPSAFSFFDGSRFRNVSNLMQYTKKLAAGHSPIDFRDAVDQEARKKELLALHLRLLSGVSLSHFEHIYGVLENETRCSLQKLCQDGLLEYEEGRYKLSKTGLFFYDTIASELI